MTASWSARWAGAATTKCCGSWIVGRTFSHTLLSCSRHGAPLSRPRRCRPNPDPTERVIEHPSFLVDPSCLLDGAHPLGRRFWDFYGKKERRKTAIERGCSACVQQAQLSPMVHANRADLCGIFLYTLFFGLVSFRVQPFLVDWRSLSSTDVIKLCFHVCLGLSALLEIGKPLGDTGREASSYVHK